MDQRRYIRRPETLQMKDSHRRYTRLWHVCFPMHKVPEEIMETDRNWPIGFYT